MFDLIGSEIRTTWTWLRRLTGTLTRATVERYRKRRGEQFHRAPVQIPRHGIARFIDCSVAVLSPATSTAQLC